MGQQEELDGPGAMGVSRNPFVAVVKKTSDSRILFTMAKDNTESSLGSAANLV